MLFRSFLSLLWATLLIGPIAFVLRGQAGGRLRRVALMGGLLSLCLLGHALSQDFYWPLGAVAYLPMLAMYGLPETGLTERYLRSHPGLSSNHIPVKCQFMPDSSFV